MNSANSARCVENGTRWLAMKYCGVGGCKNAPADGSKSITIEIQTHTNEFVLECRAKLCKSTLLASDPRTPGGIRAPGIPTVFYSSILCFQIHTLPPCFPTSRRRWEWNASCHVVAPFHQYPVVPPADRHVWPWSRNENFQNRPIDTYRSLPERDCAIQGDWNGSRRICR